MYNVRQFRFNKVDFWCCVAVFCLGVLTRILFLQDYSQSNAFPFMPYSDSYYYFLWAKDIASGDLLSPLGHVFMKWPLYAYVLGLELALMKGNVFFMQLFQFFMGVAHCMCVYFIGRVLFNRVVGCLAALLCVWYGLFIFYEGMLVYTSLSLLLNSLLFLYILRIRQRPSLRSFFWFGIFLGVGTLAQANILVFGLLAAVCILIERKKEIKNIVNQLLVFLIGLSMVIGCVTLRNYLVERDFVLIAGNLGVTFYIGNNPQASGKFDRSSDLAMNQEDMFKSARAIAKIETGKDLKTSQVSYFWFKKAIDFVRSQPIAYLKLFTKKLWYVVSPKEYVHETEYLLLKHEIRVFKVLFMDLSFIMPLALFGMMLGVRRMRQLLFLYLMVATFVLSVAMFYVAARYRIGVVPFLFIFAAYGAHILCKVFWQKRYPIFMVLSFLLFSLYLFTYYEVVFAKRNAGAGASVSALIDHHSLRATFFEQNKDYENALRELLVLGQLAPRELWVMFRLGVAYYDCRQWPLAEEKFREVVKRFPYYVNAYYNLGLMYNQQKRFNEALVVLEKAAWLDPDEAKIRFERGVAYKETGNFTQARREFEFALRHISRWRTEEKAMIVKELNGLSP